MAAEESHAGAGATPERAGVPQSPHPANDQGRQDMPSAARDHPFDIFEEPWTFREETTSHGGHVPPPPDPGYQNTTTVEQQMVAQTSSLHYHLNIAVSKMARTFESANDWTTDQIMRQAESMTDAADRLECQLARQNAAITEMRQMMLELRGQADAIQSESRLMDARLRAGFRDEIARLREEIGSSSSSKRSQPPVVPPRPARSSRIFAPPLPSPTKLRSRSSRDRFHDESHPSTLRSVRYASNTSHPESHPASTAELPSSIDSQKPVSGGRQFLRQVKSKTSLGNLYKHAENKQSVPPVPPLSVRFPVPGREV
ncbi:hypothetical protein PHISP_05604 [Aspergillus sp. HF37]|nr:hypothetical protein PHISP_05604 [Aspergillus sp. HF37]